MSDQLQPVQSAPAATTAVQVNGSDSAPWWVREIRTYGLSALVAVAFGYFGMAIYKDKEAMAREKDAVIQAQFMRSQDVVTKNTEAFNGVGENLRKNNDALDSLNRNLENLNYNRRNP